MDYENTLEEEHDGQYEEPISEEQDEDYVNTERINSHDQYDNTDSEFPAEHHMEREMQGNGMFYHKYYITSDHIFIALPFIQKHCQTVTFMGITYKTTSILLLCHVLTHSY